MAAKAERHAISRTMTGKFRAVRLIHSSTRFREPQRLGACRSRQCTVISSRI
jgi:hypothetical protein